MFNLLVSADSEAWEKKLFSLEIERCISKREYTREDIAVKFNSFNSEAIEQLKQFPCLFAYEDFCGQPPKFGWFKNIKRRTNQIIMECEYVSVDPWITDSDLSSLQASLDIYGLELSRTHYAVKDVDLAEELAQLGVTIPGARLQRILTVNPEHHNFKVGFSFPGESRPFVDKVLLELERKMDVNAIFYDNHFKAFLARPNLDVFLSKIYSNQVGLIVVFLSEDYQKKTWPGLEFRTIREIIFEKRHDKVMYIRMDDAPVDGVLKTDGYIDARSHSAAEIAAFIYQRVLHLN